MTERRDFKEYLREQIKASETTAAEAYREAADLILSSGHQAAFEKRHLAEEAWFSVLNLGLVIEYLDEQTERVKNDLVVKDVTIPEGYTLTFSLSPKPGEKISTRPRKKDMSEHAEAGPESQMVTIEEARKRSKEEIAENITNLADQLPENVLFASLNLRTFYPHDITEYRDRRYLTIKDCLGRRNLEHSLMENLQELEGALEEKLETFRKVESGESEPEAVSYLLAPERITIEEGIGKGLEVERNVFNEGIENLNLSMRGFNGIRRSGRPLIGSVLLSNEHELRGIRHFGDVSYRELVESLKERGLWPEEKPETAELIQITRGIGEGIQLTSERYQTPLSDLFIKPLTGRQNIAIDRVFQHGERQVGEVLEKTKEELLEIPRFGQKSYNVLLTRLREKGFLPEEEKPETS